MCVYKIQIAPWLYQELKLRSLTFANEQQAIVKLTNALDLKGFSYSIRQEKNKTSFINESGGELAAVVLS